MRLPLAAPIPDDNFQFHGVEMHGAIKVVAIDVNIVVLFVHGYKTEVLVDVVELADQSARLGDVGGGAVGTVGVVQDLVVVVKLMHEFADELAELLVARAKLVVDIRQAEGFFFVQFKKCGDVSFQAVHEGK